ncbi:MAG: hypothetical protein ACK5MP_00775 [Nostocoides sp.]
MTDLPNRLAGRLRSPSWRDSRLLIGIVLVLGGTAIGSVVVAHADDRVPVLVARGPLVPGEVLTTQNTDRLDVYLGRDLSRYLPASTDLSGRYAVALVRPGELIPASATGSAEEVAVQPVTVLADAASAEALVRGSVVDVYVDPAAGGTSQGFTGSRRALKSATVAADPAGDGGFGGSGSTVAVRVLMPTKAVGTIINHIDNEARITLVPVPGSLIRSDS